MSNLSERLSEKSVSTAWSIPQNTLDQIVQKIVNTARPLKIILFGSAARDQMYLHSDLDLLVIVEDGTHRRQAAQAIYRNLVGVGIAKDIVVVTESDVQKYGDNPALVLYPALREGKEIYSASR